MTRFIVHRTIQLFAVLLAVSAIIFFSLRLGPFDPTAQIAEAASGDLARIAEMRAYWGLDQPILVQYGKYLSGVARGDLGRSLLDQQPVSRAIRDRLPGTIELSVMSMLLGTAFGLGLGVLAAYKRETWLDVGSRTAALIGISFPTFWLGVMGIAIFAVKLQWLPAGGRFSSEVDFEPTTGFYVLDGLLQRRLDVVSIALQHLLLPSVVLGLLVSGLVTRITRATMLEALDKEYVRAAVARGNTPQRAAILHALPNALLPIITILGLMFGLLLSGAVIVETVFAFPGMGKLLIDAISVRDFPQVQASILVLAAMYVLINALADVLYVVADPRVRLS